MHFSSLRAGRMTEMGGTSAEVLRPWSRCTDNRRWWVTVARIDATSRIRYTTFVAV